MVDQQHRDLERILVLSENNNVGRMTGAYPAKKGRMGSESSHCSTPQVVRNDAIKGTLDLSISHYLWLMRHIAPQECCRNTTRRFADDRKSKARILGATASPGWNEAGVEEVCERLHLSGIHVRGSKETMLEPYASNLEVEEIKVPVPQELRELAKPLDGWLEAIIQRERRLGHYVRSGTITMGGLNEAMSRVQGAIARQERIAYRSAAEIAVAIRLLILSNLLVSQGVAAARESLSRMKVRAEAKGKEAKSIREFISINESVTCPIDWIQWTKFTVRYLSHAVLCAMKSDGILMVKPSYSLTIVIQYQLLLATYKTFQEFELPPSLGRQTVLGSQV